VKRRSRGTDDRLADRATYALIRVLEAWPVRRLVLWPLFSVFFWSYRRFFPASFEARLARGEANAAAWLELVERDDPELFEHATGRKARPALELPPRGDGAET
jgi:hypothetical protein